MTKLKTILYEILAKNQLKNKLICYEECCLSVVGA